MKRVVAAFALSLVVVSAIFANDWPQWRGVNRDGTSQETSLLKEWPADGPQLKWKATDIGTGYSTPTVAKGRVYVQTTRDSNEFALALDENTGKQIWSVAIGNVGKNEGPDYPGTRSSLTIDGNRAYGLSSDGELVCLDSDSGKTLWQKQFRTEFGGRVGKWAYSESVLIDGDVLVCTPGGESATLAALNKNTGEVIWKSAIPDGDIADYASIMIANVGGIKQYVQFLRKGLVGVEAKTGKFLWRYDHTKDQNANMASPVVQGNRVFSTSSRGGGGTVELKVEGESVSATELYFSRGLGAAMGGAVLVDGKLYGAGNALFCADFSTGNVLWTERSVGAASICYADGRLYVRGHGGEVALVELSAEGYREKGRFTPPDRGPKPAWPHPVVANGNLYLRDWGTLLCYDVRAK